MTKTPAKFSAIRGGNALKFDAYAKNPMQQSEAMSSVISKTIIKWIGRGDNIAFISEAKL